MSVEKPLLSVKNLAIDFTTPRGTVNAVQGVSFDLAQGGTLAIVGESGSGKSVTGLALTRLLQEPPARYVSGEILLNGDNVLAMGTKALHKVRGRRIAYVFQEPGTSLNPVFTVHSQIAEGIRIHRPDVRDVSAEVLRFLELVGIREAAKRMHDYPHQLSGGMQQRVMIAMALACQPDLLVADEPTTALDVTIQAQIMRQLRELRETLQMAVILITHNFRIIRGFADHVAVMYRGKIVEYGETEAILGNPQHLYTKQLITCIPKLGANLQRLPTIDHREIEQSLAPVV